MEYGIVQELPTRQRLRIAASLVLIIITLFKTGQSFYTSAILPHTTPVVGELVEVMLPVSDDEHLYEQCVVGHSGLSREIPSLWRDYYFFSLLTGVYDLHVRNILYRCNRVVTTLHDGCFFSRFLFFHRELPDSTPDNFVA